jgi:hypothetical protein
LTFERAEEVLACDRCENAVALPRETISSAEELGGLAYAISENWTVIGVKLNATPVRCPFPRLHDDLIDNSKGNLGVCIYVRKKRNETRLGRELFERHISL